LNIYKNIQQNILYIHICNKIVDKRREKMIKNTKLLGNCIHKIIFNQTLFLRRNSIIAIKIIFFITFISLFKIEWLKEFLTHVNLENKIQFWLTPKGSWLYFTKKHTSKLPFVVQIPIMNFFYIFNYKILHKTCMRNSGKNFIHFDQVDCKIFLFKVKRKYFFHLA